MKKIAFLILGILIIIGILLSLANSAVVRKGQEDVSNNPPATQEGLDTNTGSETQTLPKKLSIVTTIFPEYDWIMNLLGEQAANAEIAMLLDNGVDLHSYQPTVDDIVKISSCDLFVHVGGESDEWVEDALAEATNKEMIVINLMEALGDKIKEEELVEGMEAGHDHHEDDHEDHHEDDEREYDEHVWLSLKHAGTLCEAICEALCRMDPANADSYRENLTSYKERLSALDADYQRAVHDAAARTVLFGDRFPFRYLVDDYGLAYYAAFVGCSAETEASFETIVFLANKVDELGLNAVCQIESADGAIARTIIENTQRKNQQILTMNSMQSTTSQDVEKGASYLTIMEQNLDVLKRALQ